MIRLIVREDNCGMAANVGGDIHTTYKTFDVQLPELEAYLREKATWAERRLVGAELLETDTDD